MASAAFQAIQDTIYSTLEAERASGRISSVAAIGDTWLNEVSTFPYVYIDFDSLTQDPSAVRQRKQVVTYILGIAYQSSVSLSDARRQCKLLLDDGNGNGLLPILNDPANFSWQQQANWSEVVDVKLYDNGTDNQSTAAQFIAYAVIRFEVWQYLTVTGAIL
jgi:hypothetical protein